MPSLPSLPGGATAKSSTAAGGVAIVLIWLLGSFGVVVPADVAVTIAVGLIGAVGWVAHRFGPKAEPPAFSVNEFRQKFGGPYANGGLVSPGATVVFNDTGQPERVVRQEGLPRQPEPPKAGEGE